MIDQLKIKNFQSHKATTLDFVKGVNIIVGETDSGKSAIIRALRLVAYNEPNGDEFRSNWGGDTSVSLVLKDIEIARTKTNTKNWYQLSGFDIPFTAFGQSVPEEIQQALNLNEINLQQQLDSHFLISETPGKVAQHFNKVAKLDKIDKAQTKVQKEINAINSDINHLQKEIERKEATLKEFPDLKKFETKLNKLSKVIEKRDKTNKAHTNLTKLSNQINGVLQEIEEAENTIQIENSINAILDLYEKRNSIEQKWTNLNTIILKIQKTNANIEHFEKDLKLEGKINTILSLYEKKRDEAVLATKLEKLYESINKVEKRLQIEEKELKTLEKEYKKDFPEVCPLCNQKTK